MLQDCVLSTALPPVMHRIIVTFMLAPCSAGAVPLAVIVTQGQAESNYVIGFRLLREYGGLQFGCVGYPHVFMTDDSDAVHNALREVWPESQRKLCLFHVPQGNWRWFCDTGNKVAKDDRPILMSEFRSVMLATTETEAESNYHEHYRWPLAGNILAGVLVCRTTGEGRNVDVSPGDQPYIAFTTSTTTER